MPASPGRTLLHYRFAEEIGRGAMGSVWRATDTTLDRDVALKILPEALARDPELLARFEREAKMLASLHHPNLAAIYGVHDAEGTRFLPDGSGLVYMDGLHPGQDFYLLDIRTMKTRRLTTLDTAIMMRTFDITKDGQTIVFDRIRQDSDIVLIEWETR